MSIYENHICPVCKREFIDGDDIVVCPECGTPHHRECYNFIGHCVNRGLHESGYNYYEEAIADKKAEERTASEASNDFHSASEEQDKADNAGAIPNPFAIPEVDAKFQNDREQISCEDIADIAATIRINASRFVLKFKQMERDGKKTSWNWSAFIFGPLYLLYRKMYRVGIGFFSLVLAIIFAARALIYKVAPLFMGMVTDLAEAAAQGTKPTAEQVQALSSAGDAQKAVAVFYGAIGVIFIFHIIIGILADGFYKSTVLSIVKSVKEQLENGASFSQLPVFMGNEPNMTQEQMKRMYLSRKGGASFFAPAIAMLILSMVI